VCGKKSEKYEIPATSVRKREREKKKKEKIDDDLLRSLAVSPAAREDAARQF
jgi:hypothetical protein